MWHELAIAFCLVFVIEGIVPFLYPRRWKALVAQLAESDTQTIRLAGLTSMLVGTGLLYLVG